MSKINSTTVVKSVKDTKVSSAKIFTDRVIARVKSEGRLPWESGFLPKNRSYNALSGRAYNGLNLFCLPEATGFLTFKEVQSLGGSVKKGAKGYIVVYWKFSKIEQVGKDGEISEKEIPFMRYYTVFALSDCEIPEESKGKLKTLDIATVNDGKEFKSAEKIAKYYLTREQIPLNPLSPTDDCPCYIPSRDEIRMPELSSYKSSSRYWSVLFHEMTHSTGNSKRLGRLCANAYFGGRDYSKEELVAEIGSAQLSAISGLELTEIEDGHVAYLQSWLKALEDDEKLLISANSQATKAVDFILDGFDDWEEPETVEIEEIAEETKDVKVETDTAEAKIEAVRKLFEKNLISLEEYTRVIVQIAQSQVNGEGNTSPFDGNEGTQVPSDPEFDGSYNNPVHGLWKERLEVRLEKTDDRPGIVKYDIDSYQELGTGIVTISNRPCRVDYFVNIIDDTNHVSGLLPAPKVEEPETEQEKTYKYYCTRRPCDIGTVPNDLIEVISSPDFVTDYPFPIKLEPYNAVIYNRELTVEEVEKYELTPAYDMTGLWTAIFNTKEELKQLTKEQIRELKNDTQRWAKTNSWFWDFARGIFYTLRWFTLDTIDWIAVYLNIALYEDNVLPVCELAGKSKLYYGDREQTEFNEIRFDGFNWIFNDFHVADTCIKTWDVTNGFWYASFDSKKDNPKTVVKKSLVKEITKNQPVYFAFTQDGRCIYTDNKQLWISDFKPSKDCTFKKEVLDLYVKYSDPNEIVCEVTSIKMAVYQDDYGYVNPCVCLANGDERYIPYNTYKTFGSGCKYYFTGKTVIVKNNDQVVGVIMPILDKYRFTNLEN